MFGEDEILLDDSTRLEEKLKAAGVTVRLEIWAEMWHVFQDICPVVPKHSYPSKKSGVRSSTNPICTKINPQGNFRANLPGRQKWL